jgi:CheY-like chemotaxis protein
MNALKFSDNESCITISTEKKGDEVLISVSDEGIGLKHTNTEELFSRFYQGSHEKGGSGIGLSYSKMLVGKHGGTIGAINNSDQGATFFFTLPINHELVIKQESETVENEQPVLISDKSVALSSCSILIVDDNDDFLSFLREVFTSRFAEVREASDGVEALAILKEFEPDIIVSDVMMPRMDGYELCRQIKSAIQISHIPVVLLTAKSDAESEEIGYKLGADFYIAKPFDPDFLELIISNLLTAREALKQRYIDGGERLQPEEATISSADEKFMSRFNSLIGDNLSDPDLNVDFIASELAMSRASLYNKMQSLLGIGVNDYINKYRIDEAAELLKDVEMSIGEISFETGFRNQRYFSTVFKKIKGVSPSEYRNKKM